MVVDDEGLPRHIHLALDRRPVPGGAPPWTVERKRKLDGRAITYRCRRLAWGPGFALLHYRHRVAVVVAAGAIRLPPGTDTYALYWSDRAYNVYHWCDPAGRTLGFYCNAATETVVHAASVEWLDLDVDVLIVPRRAAPGDPGCGLGPRAARSAAVGMAPRGNPAAAAGPPVALAGRPPLWRWRPAWGLDVHVLDLDEVPRALCPCYRSQIDRALAELTLAPQGVVLEALGRTAPYRRRRSRAPG